jgi:integrase
MPIYRPDSKTGFKVIPLSLPALEILQKLPIMDQYVFPSSTSASGHMEGLRKPWNLLYTRAKLQGRWRVHDLRHAFASMMVNSGPLCR